MTAETTVTPMKLYELYWAAGTASGTLTLWAPDPDSAIQTVQANPSTFGIPHEHPLVGHPTSLPWTQLRLDAQPA